MPHAFLDHPGPIAFAHRGGLAHHPENSWPAFEHAVSLGYQYLETDAQATADGVLVAFHDRTLNRVTDRVGRIAHMTHQEVTSARIGGAEPIPVLEDLLAAWPGIRFNIDVKDEPAIRPLAALIRRRSLWDRVCVCSFSAHRLRAFRRALGDRVCTALSPPGIASVGLAGNLPGAGAALATQLARAGICCAQVPNCLASRTLIRRVQAVGLHVHVWTVNDRTRMNCLLDLGADGIMADDALLLREVLSERGEWHAGARRDAEPERRVAVR